jgi:hypothetical protein
VHAFIRPRSLTFSDVGLRLVIIHDISSHLLYLTCEASLVDAAPSIQQTLTMRHSKNDSPDNNPSDQ